MMGLNSKIGRQDGCDLGNGEFVRLTGLSGKQSKIMIMEDTQTWETVRSTNAQP